MRKVIKGDDVVVLVGKDRGRRGVVKEVTGDGKIVVAGVNMVKKHQKPNPFLNTPGGIVEFEKPVDASNVALWNPVAQKADRVGFRILEDGRKVRYFKSNGELVKG